MGKLYIQGDLIGTTADNVEYTNSDMNGVTHAKGALDNLNTRMKAVEQGGGDSSDEEIDNESLAYLADTMVETSGIASDVISTPMYYNPNNAAPADGAVFVEDRSHTIGAGAKLAINEGEILHYVEIGMQRVVNDNVYGYIFVDSDNKVILRGAKAASAANPTVNGQVTAPAGSRYVYISCPNDTYSKVWIEYENRPHLKDGGILQCYGDSIMSYSEDRIYPYPQILAAMLGVQLYKHSYGGASIGAMGGWIKNSRCDADVYLDAIGYNNTGSTIGTASDALEILPADGSYKNLTSEQVTQLQSTVIGHYWYYLNVIMDFAVKPNAQFVCVGFFGLGAIGQNLINNTETFRTELEALVNEIREENTNVHYIDGQKYVLRFSSYFYADQIHPNQLGQWAIANGLYPFLADLFGKMDVAFSYDIKPKVRPDWW